MGAMPVHVVDHPLARHHLSRLRLVDTPPADFRRHLRQLVSLLAFEATRDLNTVETRIETPLCATAGHTLAPRVALVPILRAGLGLVDPLLELIPDAVVWHLGIYRDEETARPVEYYSKLPERDPPEVALVLDPMLATGGSAMAALTRLGEWGVPQLKLLSVIAAQPGVERVLSAFPGVSIYTCGVDPELNDRQFIVPGLGDAGDRMFNTGAVSDHVA
jgi:uracil phosphoribosyltransferase